MKSLLLSRIEELGGFTNCHSHFDKAYLISPKLLPTGHLTLEQKWAYFKKMKNGKTKFQGHCYVTKKELEAMSKQEKRCMESDIKKGRIVYRNKKYKLIKNS